MNYVQRRRFLWILFLEGLALLAVPQSHDGCGLATLANVCRPCGEHQLHDTHAPWLVNRSPH